MWWCTNLLDTIFHISWIHTEVALLEHMTNYIYFFLRHVHAVFHSDFTKWHSHQQMFHFVHILTRIYHSLSLGCQPFWQEWGYIYIYIYITVVLMAKDVEKFFHVFLCHLYFFIRVLPFDIICHVLTRLLAFLLWNWVADMFY